MGEDFEVQTNRDILVKVCTEVQGVNKRLDKTNGTIADILKEQERVRMEQACDANDRNEIRQNQERLAWRMWICLPAYTKWFIVLFALLLVANLILAGIGIENLH